MPNAPMPTFTVTGQRPDYGPGPAGTFVPGVVVSFETANGHPGQVFIPEAGYTVEAARKAIAARAAVVEGIAALTE